MPFRSGFSLLIDGDDSRHVCRHDNEEAVAFKDDFLGRGLDDQSVRQRFGDKDWVDMPALQPGMGVLGKLRAHRWVSGGFDKDSTTLAESICLLGSSFVSSASARLRMAALLDDVSFCWPVISREIVASLRPETSASRFWVIPLATRKARISVVIVSMTKNYTNEIYLARFISSS